MAREAAAAAAERRRQRLDVEQERFASAIFKPFADRWPKLLKLKQEATVDGGTNYVLEDHDGAALSLAIELDEENELLIVEVLAFKGGEICGRCSRPRGAYHPTFGTMANALGREIASFIAGHYLDPALVSRAKKGSVKPGSRPMRKK